MAGSQPLASQRGDSTTDETLSRFISVRARTEELCEPLDVEDMMVQSMDDVSPTKWHLAHTTWFFETFILERHVRAYEPFDPAYKILFNSYYNAVGDMHPRPRRGLLSRPTAAQVYDYRRHVDSALGEFVGSGNTNDEITDLVTLGCHHEQQHQELILTDIKHVLSCNPLQPAYRADTRGTDTVGYAGPTPWLGFEGGLSWIGAPDEGFAFDNERPRHKVYVEPFELAARPVTNGEFAEFIEDGGYRRANLWLSDGWDAVNRNGWTMPQYWQSRDGEYAAFTLSGVLPLRDSEPVCHISHYEADAFARWAGARLPTEAEWEVACDPGQDADDTADLGIFRPRRAPDIGQGPVAMLGSVWEWTASAYTPYSGYKQAAGALGEYNGKFMSGQVVLRGGSCLTAAGHIRPTYRNFFPPAARWQMSGLRLARNLARG